MRLRASLRAIPASLVIACEGGEAAGPGVLEKPGRVRLLLISGDLQSGVVGTVLSEPLVVEARLTDGRPADGSPVLWTVLQGGGLFETATTVADSSGRVAAIWRLGTTAGSNIAAARAEGGDSALFRAVGWADAPVTLASVSGSDQAATVESSLPESLRVRAEDRYGNGVRGVLVRWRVAAGGGRVDPDSTLTEGIYGAGARFWVGRVPGSPQSVEASADGLDGSPVFFAASATPGPFVTPLDVGLGAACAGINSGKRVCWGGNFAGEFGSGATAGSAVPVRLSDAIPLVDISIGRSHACGLTSIGEAMCWGANEWGQLGDGSMTPRFTPGPVSGGLRFRSISAGSDFTCAVTITLAAYCWGLNNWGNLGTNADTVRCGTSICERTPTQVIGGYQFESVTAAVFHACGVTVEGEGYCWGANIGGVLGDGTTDGGSRPKLVAGGFDWAQIVVGGAHTCGLTTGGWAFCWGPNSNGALGTGDSLSATVPAPVTGSLTFGQLSGGFDHTCGVSTTGEAYCWGNNSFGQLGDSTAAAVTRPVLVVGALSFVRVEAGYSRSCGLATNGAVYCWGNNNGGTLGIGATSSTPPYSAYPRRVLDPP
jgi:alpha-tubulin suppressor-like RCC1 family protein